MKKTYISPLCDVEFASITTMLAASRFTPDVENQDINLTDDEYDGEFGAKEYVPTDYDF